MADETTTVIEKPVETTPPKPIDNKTGTTGTEPAVTDETVSTWKERAELFSKKFDQVNTKFVKATKELEDERKKTMSIKELEDLKHSETLKTLEMRETELETERLNFNKTKLLNEKKWDGDFLDIVMGDSINTFEENCKKMEKKIKDLVEKEVNARLASGNPVPKGGIANESYYTIEEMKSMTRETIMANYDKVKKSQTYWQTKK